MRVKRTFSLLEVTIAMILTGILLTTLFSSFRQMVVSNRNLQKIRTNKHWTYITHMRLTQVFETLEKAKCEDGVLSITFNNGADPDPKYADKVKATLALTKEEFVLKFEDERKEVFKTEAKNGSFSFFNPKTKEWEEEWKSDSLFPALKITVDGQTFAFLIPKAETRVVFE